MTRFVVYGAGAVGGVVGARLARAGHSVALIARGAHREAIARQGGLVVDGALVPLTLMEPSAIASGDVVMLAVKSQDTQAALASIGTSGVDVPVVSLQNGVANERVALRCFSRVYGVTVMCPCTHLMPGAVEAGSAPITGILDIGRYPSSSDALCHEIARAFASATFVSEVRDDIMRWKWRKLVMNLSNAITALCVPGPASDALVDDVRAEGERVMALAGIDLVSDAEDLARRGDLLQKRASRSGGSTWQSFQRGTGT
ncbi:MAG TPA: 2-dehydropantoate 2-reductase N-terminal domain-containing protein, partial [Myxococcota bacterium]